MTEQQARIIMAYAEKNMNVRAAGLLLYMSEGMVSYHLNKIFLKTRRNPRKFFDLCYLVGIAALILGGNEHENK